MRFNKAVLLFAAAGMVVSACGDDKKEADTSTTKAATASSTAGSAAGAGGTVDCKPIKAGVLSVVTSLPGPNFWGAEEETDPDKIKSGIEYDLANQIAAKCGLKMQFRNESFDAIVAGQIDPQSYDISLTQATITEDRAKVIDFSTGYFKADQGILVKDGVQVKSWDDVKKLKLGVQASTTAEYYFQEVPGWKIDGVKSFPDLAAAYTALDAGTIDAVVIDTPINLGQTKQMKGVYVPAQFKTGEEYGAIFGKDNGKKAVFDPIIKGLVDDGSVNKLIEKYLGGDPSKVPFVDVPTS